MQPFRIHTGKVAPLERANVDTDQIVPKQFLKRTERTGYGEFLFYGWRYRQDGAPDSTFVLNDPRYREASILLAGRNFGCGSSREHAPWALLDYGFRAIIAPSFADIFAMNCSKNGILTAVLDEGLIAELIGRTIAQPGYQLIVDLEKCELRDQAGFAAKFAIDEYRRKFLLEGLDDIGITLQYDAVIAQYEAHRQAFYR